MKNVGKIFDTMSILFGVILIFWVTQINYNDLSLNNNLSPYLGIISAVLFIFVMQFAKRHQVNKQLVTKNKKKQ
ncbi:hypothetical protein [uncultured Tenacibaculum sp.]|uniref:hypothetical protein n=1 Tax=uncultured Tenacibaculum sp. TaxID=174713 RepID=UPI00262DD3B9|nr:hypothetical protein [uncultured Tenacibaculum sp.]